MDWNDLKLFVALVRSGTVRAAASQVGVSHSTIARRVDALESQLRVKLFDRPASGYLLTQAGEELLATAEKVENEMDALARRIVGQDRLLAGQIRVTMIDVLATHLIIPQLATFYTNYPNIELDIVVSYEPLDLTKREADIALRFVKQPPDHLIGRKLGTTANAAYATKQYLLDHDLSQSSSANWIGYGSSLPFPKWVKQSHYPHLPAKGIFNSMLLQLEATRAGLGIGFLPCFLGDASPELERLAPYTPSAGHDLWLLRHPDTRSTARLRVFSDFVSDVINQHHQLLDGIKAV